MSITFNAGNGEDVRNVNFSNVNALTLLKMAGIEPDYAGILPHHKIGDAIKTLTQSCWSVPIEMIFKVNRLISVFNAAYSNRMPVTWS